MSCTPGPGRMFVMPCDCQSFSLVSVLLWDCMYSCYYYEFTIAVCVCCRTSLILIVLVMFWYPHTNGQPQCFTYPFPFRWRQILRRGSSDSANWPLWEAGEEVGRSWRTNYTPLRKQNSNIDKEPPKRLLVWGRWFSCSKWGFSGSTVGFKCVKYWVFVNVCDSDTLKMDMDIHQRSTRGASNTSRRIRDVYHLLRT